MREPKASQTPCRWPHLHGTPPLPKLDCCSFHPQASVACPHICPSNKRKQEKNPPGSDMDYTHPNFFSGAPPYQFIGAQVPPLTPSHSNSVASEDFNTTSPPVGCAPGLPNRDIKAKGRCWPPNFIRKRPVGGQLCRFLVSCLAVTVRDSAFCSLGVVVARI